MKKTFFLVPLLLLFVPACASLKSFNSTDTLAAASPQSAEEEKLRETKKAEKEEPARISDPRAYFHFMAGSLLELENNIPAAFQEFRTALSIDPKSETLLFELANLALRLGETDLAESYVNTLLEENPAHVDALMLLGEIEVSRNRLDRAVEAYQKAIALRPDDQDTYFEIASLFMKQNMYPEAEKIVRKLISQKPKSPVGYYYLGRIFFEQKKNSEALAQFQQALKFDPLHELSWMGIGLVYEADGDRKKAISHYRKYLDAAGPNHRDARQRIILNLAAEGKLDEARRELEDFLRIDPNDLEANFRLAVLLAEQKNYDRAIVLLSFIIDRRGDHDPRLMDYLGFLYEAANHPEKAEETYRKVISIDKTFTDSVIHLASLYVKEKKTDLALQALSQAQTDNPPKAEVFLTAEGWVYLQLEKYEDAINAFNKALKINSKNPDIYFNLGQTYDKMSRFEDMEKEMKKAIEIDPANVNALNYLGYSYAEKNIKLKEAGDLIRRALQGRPNDGYIIDSLAWVYYKEGKLDEAVRELKKALSFVPEDPTIHEHLGEVLVKKNLKNEAREEFIRSIELNPSNPKLLERYQGEFDLGDPMKDDRIQKALKKGEPSPPSLNQTNQAETPRSKI